MISNVDELIAKCIRDNEYTVDFFERDPNITVAPYLSNNQIIWKSTDNNGAWFDNSNKRYPTFVIYALKNNETSYSNPVYEYEIKNPYIDTGFTVDLDALLPQDENYNFETVKIGFYLGNDSVQTNYEVLFNIGNYSLDRLLKISFGKTAILTNNTIVILNQFCAYFSQTQETPKTYYDIHCPISTYNDLMNFNSVTNIFNSIDDNVKNKCVLLKQFSIDNVVKYGVEVIGTKKNITETGTYYLPLYSKVSVDYSLNQCVRYTDIDGSNLVFVSDEMDSTEDDNGGTTGGGGGYTGEITIIGDKDSSLDTTKLSFATNNSSSNSWINSGVNTGNGIIIFEGFNNNDIPNEI
jgi:hypothetical protein